MKFMQQTTSPPSEGDNSVPIPVHLPDKLSEN